MKISIRIIPLILLFSLQNAQAQKEALKPKPKRDLTPIKKVSCDHCNQKLIYSPRPKYSKAAQAAGAKGAVKIRILIDEKGQVISAKPVSGHPLLWAESVKAALQTKFEPFLLSGNPAKVYDLLIYNFVLNSSLQSEQSEIIEKKIKESNEIIKGEEIKLVIPPSVSCTCRFGKKNIVIVETQIDEQGNVIKATAITGHPILKQVSEQAARHSKFSSTIVSGVPVKAKALIIYEFALSGKWAATFTDVYVKNIQAEN